MTLLTGLSYDTAVKVMESIGKSSAMQYIAVHISWTGDSNGWSIKADCRLLRGLFNKDPHKFVVELDDELVKKINKEQKDNKDLVVG
jgi:hypothetical protein